MAAGKEEYRCWYRQLYHRDAVAAGEEEEEQLEDIHLEGFLLYDLSSSEVCVCYCL